MAPQVRIQAWRGEGPWLRGEDLLGKGGKLSGGSEVARATQRGHVQGCSLICLLPLEGSELKFRGSNLAVVVSWGFQYQ